MSTTAITFPGSQGHALVARLDTPDSSEPKAYALFAHCFTCNKNLRAISNITRALNAGGVAVMRFDFTGLGESEGDFADTNFSSNVDDLVTAANWMAEEYEAPALLIGHSLGGAAVLRAALSLPDVKAVATIGAPADPGHVQHLLQNGLKEIAETGEARLILAGREFTIKKQFLDDLEASSMRKCIRELKRALIVFHAPLDNTVGIDNAGEIFTQARHPKSFISLDDADHLLTRSRDSKYVGAVISQWVTRYL